MPDSVQGRKVTLVYLADCNVWESLQLLRQDQIYSDRSQIQRQINLTVPTVQAEVALIDAKQSIAEKELEYTLQVKHYRYGFHCVTFGFISLITKFIIMQTS